MHVRKQISQLSLRYTKLAEATHVVHFRCGNKLNAKSVQETFSEQLDRHYFIQYFIVKIFEIMC